MAIDVGTAVGYLDLDTSKFRKGFKSAADDLKTFETTAKGFEGKTKALGSAMSSVGSSMTKWVTTPLVGAGAAVVGVASNFESAMSKVQAISGATGEDLQALNEKAQEMGNTTIFSASEAAEAMQYMAMAGWKTEDMLDGISGIMDLAAASGEDLALTSDIVTDALTAFGLQAQDSAAFADVLAAASSNANTNVSKMGESFKYVAPVAGAMGYSVEDISIALGLMGNASIKASQAGTSLRTAITNMVKPTDDMAGVMEEYGISLTDAEGNMKPFIEILKTLRESMGGLDEATQASAATTLFGKEAMSGMLAIINASEEDFNKLSEAIYNADGTSAKMADTMQDTLTGQLTTLKGTLEGIAISFGNLLLPIIKKVVGALQDLLYGINHLSEGQKKAVVNIAAFVAALGPILLIGGKILDLVSKVKFQAIALKPILIAIKGAIVGIGAPVLGVIAAVIAAVVALKLAWDHNFGGIQEKTQAMWEAIKGTFEAIVNLLGQFGELFSQYWDALWNNCGDTLSLIWDAMETLFSDALDILLNAFEFFENIFSGNWEAAWQNVKNILSSIADGMVTLIVTFFGTLIRLIENAVTGLWSAAVYAFNGIKDGFTEIWGEIKDWFSKAIEDPVGTVESIGKSLYEAGRSIFNSLWDGLSSVWDSITSWVSDSINWLLDKISIWDRESSRMDRSSVSVSERSGKDRVYGSYASGLDYVPRDMLVQVHQGESIRTKQQTRGDFNRPKAPPKSSKPVQFNFNVDGRTLAKVTVDNINDLTDTNGEVPLKI